VNIPLPKKTCIIVHHFPSDVAYALDDKGAVIAEVIYDFSRQETCKGCLGLEPTRSYCLVCKGLGKQPSLIPEFAHVAKNHRPSPSSNSSRYGTKWGWPCPPWAMSLPEKEFHTYWVKPPAHHSTLEDNGDICKTIESMNKTWAEIKNKVRVVLDMLQKRGLLVPFAWKETYFYIISKVEVIGGRVVVSFEVKDSSLLDQSPSPREISLDPSVINNPTAEKIDVIEAEMELMAAQTKLKKAQEKARK
jgi:hypothetical protein